MQKVKNFLVLISYFITLLYIYIDYVSFVFESEGFVNDFSYSKLFEAFSVIVVLSSLISCRRVTVSGFFSTLILLVVYIPIAVLYVGANKSVEAFYLATLSVFITMLVSFYIDKFQIKFDVPYVRKGRVLFLYFCFFMLFFFLIKVILSGALARINFNVDLVYQLRGAQEGALYNGMWGYLTNWIVKVFSIVLIVFSAHKKKYYLLLVLLLLQFLFYGITTHKSTFFYAVIALCVYYLLSFGRANYLMVKFFTLGIMIFFAFATVLDNIYVGSFMLRRALFVPAQLYYVYIDFFSFNPNVFWSNSILSSFLNYPYDLNTAKVVGSYLGDSTQAANNGYLASGYMQAGVFGVLLYTAFLILILTFLDAISKALPPNAICAILIAPMISLITSADLVTSLFSHGVVIAVLACYFLNSGDRIEN